MRVAIHQNHEIFQHSTSWDNVWIDYCKVNNIEYSVVNCFDNDIIERLKEYDILLWHFSNYSMQEMLFARSVLYCANNMGLKVFPDFCSAWHFDDKISETYLLNSIHAPIPKSWVFYTLESASNFFETYSSYPIVAKLKSGSGSSNVQLIKNANQGRSYAKTMFGRGFKSAPNILFKTKSNIQSARDWSTIVSRFKRIPDFIQSYTKASKLPREKGYVFLQEFVPNNGFDLKVAVVGDKLSFLARNVRKGDFRASGGGSINYDKSLITSDIRRISFEISEKLGFQSMGYDFVIDKRKNEPKIIEISYGYSHAAQMELGGYWNSSGEWMDQPLNAPVEILRNLLG